MSIITTVLLIFLLVCVILLLVPFHISLKLQKIGGVINGIFELRWFRLKIFTKKFPEKEDQNGEKEAKAKAQAEKIEKKKAKEKEKKEKDKTKRKFKWEDIKIILKLAWKSLEHLIVFLEDIIKSVSIKNIQMHVILGFNSPVDTAKTLGYFWATSSLINVHPKVNLSAEPSFNQERVDGDLLLELEVKLINPLIAVIKLLTKKSILKLIWELRRFRK